MVKTTTCNMCGKKFDFWDEQENFSLTRRIGYGSKFDTCHLQLDLCCECMDKIIEQCVISPIEEENEE